MSLEMVTRQQWGAMPPCHLDPLEPPVEQVAFVHSSSLTCHDKEECCKLMRFMQRCHMGVHQTADMKHNFYIARDGSIYEGRGWLKNTSNYEPVSDENGFKGKFITIARIGSDFQDDPATPEELASKKAIIKYGIEQNIISPNYRDIEGLFYQYYGDSYPPDEFLYTPWEPPPSSETERTLMYRCTTNSAWEELEKGPPEVYKKPVKPKFIDDFEIKGL